MKIAILSDIHDHVWTLRAALRQLGEVDQLICCGDLCSPFIVALMAEGFGGLIHIIEGNNDGDWRRISQQAARFSQVHLQGEFFAGEIDGKRIAASHYPEVALPVAQTGQYDLVCYGHNHQFTIARQGSTLTLNPGTLLGYDPIHQRDIPATFIVYDTRSNVASGYQVLTKMAVRSEGDGIMPYPWDAGYGT